MVELVIQVQKSALKISEEIAEKRLWWNKVIVTVTSLILAVGGVGFSWAVRVEENQNKAKFAQNFTDYYLPSVLIALSTGLTTASCYLVVNARRYFGPVLKEESCRVQTIHIIYTSTYLTRALVHIIL